MQSENFDKKIKETLSQRPPGNEKPEWDKMEKLLNEHLPVKKDDRRRVIFIIFLFMLLGGGAFLIWENNRGGIKEITQSKPSTDNLSEPNNTSTPNNNKNSTESIVAVKPSPIDLTTNQNSTDKNASPVQAENSLSQQNKKPIENNEVTVIESIRRKINSKPVNHSQSNERTNDPVISKNRSNANKESVNRPDNSQSITSTQRNDQQANISTPTKPVDQINNDSQKNNDQKNTNDLVKTDTENKVSEQKTNETKESQQLNSRDSQPTLTANSKAEKKRPKNSFDNKLFFALSAGTDFSSVGLGEVGKLQPVLGIGIGYQVSKKFAIRTGFYSARKVYTANPEDYNPPASFWNYYPNLKTIDANCKVYEIPVLIDLTIKQNNKQSWFASAGLSSLLMKKETYEYYFKPASSPTYITYSRTITNQNKHYFSILDLSGGYTRILNKNISLRVEPYAKFALSGVGYGKVKLNSGGILLSAIIKPFARK